MQRTAPARTTIAELDLTGLPPGEILHPMRPVSEAERSLHEAWERPLSPWGGFSVDAGIGVGERDGRSVLSFDCKERWERALLARGVDMRDGHVRAEVLQTGVAAAPDDDRHDVSQALAGIVFRWVRSRNYYQFGLEGRSRAVLYRRRDDEWHVLAERLVDVPDGFVTLEVDFMGDGIRCRCVELDVEFLVTDTAYPSGKVGIRVHAGADVASFGVEQTGEQRARDVRRRERERLAEDELGRDVPDAVLIRTIDVAELGGAPIFSDFATPGRHDMLVQGDDRLRAFTAEGEPLWETRERIRGCVLSRDSAEQGRLIYGFAGVREERHMVNVSGGVQTNTIDDEMVVLQGDTGEVVARERLPDGMPGLQMYDWSPTSASLSGDDATDVVLREWRRDRGCQGGGLRLWALDRHLSPLWEHEQSGAHYGHHHALAFHDIDGDGRDELLAGGVMYAPDGCILWVHDRAEEMTRIEAARHYDAVAVGALAGSDDEDPTAFLVSGSAGVHVVDALNGETRTVHRIGHAQGRIVGKVRPDLPGTEVLVATRWGNYGILTLFSGRGERLWSIQPDYVGQGATPLAWGSEGHKLIWTNTSRDAQALWDGHGRRVKRLPALSRVWGDRMGREVGRGGSPLRMGRYEGDYLTLTVDGAMHVFGPDE